MAETPISQADIDGLAGTLDGLNLSIGQRALLAAIVRAAAEPIVEKTTLDVEVGDPVPSFRVQFANAFKPGTVIRLDPGSGVLRFKIGR